MGAPFPVRVSFSYVGVIFKPTALISCIVVRIIGVAGVEANQETSVLKGSRMGIDRGVQFDLH